MVHSTQDKDFLSSIAETDSWVDSSNQSFKNSEGESDHDPLVSLIKYGSEDEFINVFLFLYGRVTPDEPESYR